MRRLIPLVALLLSLAPAAVAKEIAADRYDVTIRALADGSIQVTETARLHFRGGPFTYVSREVPLRMTDGIEVLGASMDGRVMARGGGAGQFDVRRRESRVAVRWQFAATSDSTHEFRVSYLVRGLIRRAAGGGLLEWQAIPTEHSYSITTSRIVLEGDGLDREPSLRTRRVANTQTARVNGRWQIEARGIERNGWIAIAAAAPLTDAAIPRWQLRQQRQRELAPRMVMIGVLALAFSLVVVLFIWRQYPSGPLTLEEEWRTSNPPAPRAPALAAAIAAGGRSSNAHVAATLFDLAGRGVMSVAETEARWKAMRKFVLTRQRAGRLARHEAALLDILFRDADTIEFSKVASRIATRGAPFRRAVQEELRELGLIDDQRRGVRRRLFGLAIALLAFAGAGAGIGFLMLREAGVGIVAIPIGFMAAGAVAVVLAVTLPELSDDGLRERERWRGFTRALKEQIETGQALQHLPYVAAMGLASPLSRRLRRHGADAALPPWFRALSGPEGPTAFAAFIGAAATTTAGRAGGSSVAGGGSSSAG